MQQSPDENSNIDRHVVGMIMSKLTKEQRNSLVNISSCNRKQECKQNCFVFLTQMEENNWLTFDNLMMLLCDPRVGAADLYEHYMMPLKMKGKDDFLENIKMEMDMTAVQKKGKEKEEDDNNNNMDEEPYFKKNTVTKFNGALPPADEAYKMATKTTQCAMIGHLTGSKDMDRVRILPMLGDKFTINKSYNDPRQRKLLYDKMCEIVGNELTLFQFEKLVHIAAASSTCLGDRATFSDVVKHLENSLGRLSQTNLDYLISLLIDIDAIDTVRKHIVPYMKIYKMETIYDLGTLSHTVKDTLPSSASITTTTDNGKTKNSPASSSSSSKTDEYEDEDKNLCAICLDSERDHVVLPCAHRCLCQECLYIAEKSKECPMCRGPVASIIKIFN